VSGGGSSCLREVMLRSGQPESVAPMGKYQSLAGGSRRSRCYATPQVHLDGSKRLWISGLPLWAGRSKSRSPGRPRAVTGGAPSRVLGMEAGAAPLDVEAQLSLLERTPMGRATQPAPGASGRPPSVAPAAGELSRFRERHVFVCGRTHWETRSSARCSWSTEGSISRWGIRHGSSSFGTSREYWRNSILDWPWTERRPSDAAKRRATVLGKTGISAYLQEFAGLEGAKAFLNGSQNYPLLVGYRRICTMLSCPWVGLRVTGWTTGAGAPRRDV